MGKKKDGRAVQSSGDFIPSFFDDNLNLEISSMLLSLQLEPSGE